MFELSVACKYLIPRWRQISVSLISLVSILVIALVVWLIVVFFSVKDGLENSWIEKLVTLTAPIRVTPTEEYYNSFYYQIDSISSNADFTHKTLGEKLQAEQTNPYDPTVDEEVPLHFKKPDAAEEGELKDLVKTAYRSIAALPQFHDLSITDYEMSAANMRLYMERKEPGKGETEQFLEQTVYISSFDRDAPSFSKTLLTPTAEDLKNHSSHPLPFSPQHQNSLTEAVFVPRSYREAGVLMGDRGYVSYYSATPSSIQEQRIPIYVAGFYDPGIMPIGGKFLLASRTLTGLIRASHAQEDLLESNGFNVRFSNLQDVRIIKAALVDLFKKEGIDAYWKIETYQEYPFTKDLIQQLHSEKNLFSLISIVIIIVACSNIISMLILLVNDKKLEIGILRSMGATSLSIAIIFGLCGVVMGALGSVIGITLAIFTLRHLDFLVDTLSRWQGYDLFNPVFYGNTLPNQISMEVLGYVIAATAFISLLAGIVPALKASVLKPASILRAE